MKHKETLVTVLMHVIGLKRPYGSKEEASVVDYLARTLPHKKLIDGAGNLHIDLRRGDANRTLFVGHTDTVHRQPGVNLYSMDGVMLRAKGDVLGADDGAGVAILASMIEAGVPAYYIFTRGEERGGIGSRWLAKHKAALLGEFDRAIAFDRRGYSDVITHQAMGRCASEDFAEALSDELNSRDLLYMPSSEGIYTDTAEFTHIIPECTNVSVGYHDEHSDKESLNMEHFLSLAQAVIEIDWDGLPTKRDPHEIDEEPLWWLDYVKSAGKPIESIKAYSAWDQCIEDAVFNAIEGSPHNLIEILAEHIDPDNVDIVRRQLDRTLLKPEYLENLIAEHTYWDVLLDELAEDAVVVM